MLFKKMLRDLKRHRTQFISIFLMIFMGVFTYTGLNAVGRGMSQSGREFYNETNLADAFLYGGNFTKEEVRRLEQEDSISKAERRLKVDAALESDAKTTLQLNFVESNQVSSNHITEGEPFHPDGKGIWIDSSFAEANSLKVGDTIGLTVQGNVLSETIKGFIMNPEYVYAVKDDNEVIPNHACYGYAFLSAKEFNASGEIPFNEIIMKTDADKDALEEIKDRVFQSKYTVLLMRKDHPSVSMFENEVNQMYGFQAVFPIVFLLIAVLTTLTTMTRITMNQRTQIGTLKAVGFANRRVLLHYTGYGAFIGALGGILGLFAGPLLLPRLIFSFQKTFYAIPEWQGSIEPEVFLVAVLCMAGCGLSGYLACRKELHGAAAEILRPKAPKIGKHTALEKSRCWNCLTFDFQWNIRDLLRNRIRSLITVIGIIGCMALIICALGMQDTIRSITDISYRELNAYEVKVSLSEDVSAEQIQELKEDGKVQFIQEGAIELDLENGKESAMMTVIGTGNHIRQKDTDNRFTKLPESGIAVTEKFAELHSLAAGDMLTWRIYGSKDWVTGKIAMIISNPISQGAFISEKAYKGLKQTMLPTAFVTNEDAGNFIREEFGSVQTREELIKSIDSLLETTNVIVAVLILAAVLLGAVVLYNLGVLSFNERVRELTTLKVLGFQYSKLRRLLQMQNIWLTLAGTLLGVPGGYLLLSYMMKLMGDSFDLRPLLTALSLGISILGTLLLSVAVNFFLSRRLKTIDMVSALKSVE